MATFVSGVSLFDPTAYLALNTDVKAAAGSLSGQALNDFAYNHFLNFGAGEGRDPLGMVTTSSVPNTLTKGNITGDIGGNGVASGGVFDAAYYLTINTDVNAAAITAANGLAASGKVVPSNFFATFALTHFVQFGAVEGRAPSAAFDQGAYRSAQGDVNSAIVLHQTTAIQHYLQFGEKEGRAAPAVSGAVQGGGNPGSNFVLTTGVDNLTGTSGNDTFVADNTGATAQTSIADSLNGGGGTDTLKIFSKTGTNALDAIPQLSSVEVLFINGANYNGKTLDVSTVSGLTGLQIDGPTAASGDTDTFTILGQALTLSNYTNSTTGNVTIAVTSTADTTANLTLSKWTQSSSTNTVDFTGTKYTTLNVTSTGGSNNAALKNTGGAITTLKLLGDQSLSSKLDATLDGTLKSIDASAATGKMSIDISAAVLTVAGFTFTGGTGADTLTLKAGDLGIITAGSQLDGGAGSDTLTINDNPTTAIYTTLNATKNFEILGLGVAATVDASQITATFANHYNVANTGTNKITNLADSSTVDITKSGSTDTFGPAVGASTLNLNIGSSSSTGLSETLTLTGYSTVNVASNGDTTGTNALGTLVNSDNTKFVFTGANKASVTLATGTATGDRVDASAMTGALSVTGSNKGDILIGGSGADSITAGSVQSSLTGNGGIDTFNVASSLYAAAKNIDNITDFTKGTDKLTVVAQGTDTFTTAAFNVSAATTLQAALGLAASSTDGSTNGAIKWFAFGGNTYVLEVLTNNGAGLTDAATTDLVVKLTGAIDLSTVTLATATLS